MKSHLSLNADRLASYQNTPGDRGGRWIESPEAAGLRFVGWADDIVKVDHMGWFLYPDGDPGECARGCVYQLPARKGRPIYVEALRTGDSFNGRRGWRDNADDGAAYVFLGERHEGDPGGTDGDIESAMRDAAHGANREAETYAEAEREYHEAFQAGQLHASLIHDAGVEREAARELVGELRDFLRDHALPAKICATIRAGIRAHLNDYREAIVQARTLASDWRSSINADAFNEGAEL